jgi:glycosyltransferase involved in cell wall biosynthesis
MISIMITINPMSNCLMTTLSPTGAFPSHWRHKPSGRRKILFFYQDFGQMGGIERYLLNLGQAFVTSNDFEPVFLCSDNTPLFHQLKALGCSVYGVQSSAFFARSFLRSLDVFALRSLKRVIETEKIDIAHVHIGLLETWLVKQWGCAVVFTFHGYGSLYSDRFAKHSLQRWFKSMVKLIFKTTAKGLDQLLIVSYAEQKRLIREGFLSPQNSGRVLQNGKKFSRKWPTPSRQRYGLLWD